MINHNYLQVALFKSKIPKSIYEVKTGIACDCYCPICKTQLEAKNKGKEWGKPLKEGQRIAHFAHSDGSNCSGASESILHKIAKNVLKETLTLKLPTLHHNGVKLNEGMILKFDTCVLEERVNIDNTHIQPDAILLKNKTELYIEFYKTHLVGEDKIEKIKKLNKSTIEIDLNEIPILKEGQINKNEIKEFLINSKNNRFWLHNSQIDKLHKKYLETLKNKEKQEQITDTEDEEEFLDDFENSSRNTRFFYSRGVDDQVKLDNWKNDLKKKDYKFLKIYRYPKYDWVGKRKSFEGMIEEIYCPKLKNSNSKKKIDLFDCERCEYNGKMVKNDVGDWRVVCKFTLEKFLQKDKEMVKKLKGEELLSYCFNEKYPLIDNNYIQTLITIYSHIGKNMYRLLEEAEMKNKKLSIVDNPNSEINDQYFLKDI